MTKEVKLRICGMHMHGEDGDRDDVEVISVGQMCERDGFAWITYEEVVEDGQLEIIKHGPAESHMVFVPNETTYSYYSPPVGELEIALSTKSLQKILTERGFHLKLDYDLELNQTFLSNCNVDIFIEE